MARITVDDCMKQFSNRFELTLAATNRARQIALGATPLVEPNKDKPTVIALRTTIAPTRAPSSYSATNRSASSRRSDSRSRPERATASRRSSIVST